MTKVSLIIGAALAGIIASSQVMADDAKPALEKCYGIAKAGKNDCKSTTGGNACAGLTTKDGQGFLILPKGACEKVVGGSIEEKK